MGGKSSNQPGGDLGDFDFFGLDESDLEEEPEIIQPTIKSTVEPVAVHVAGIPATKASPVSEPKPPIETPIDNESLAWLDELDDFIDNTPAVDTLEVEDSAVGESKTPIESPSNELRVELSEAELDAIEQELLDDELSKSPPVIIQPEIVQWFANISDDQLIKRITEIHQDAGDNDYDESTRQEFWEINVELTERNVLPYKRITLPKFDGVTCRQEKTSLYMRDLQAVDKCYVWRWYNGRKTFGSYAGIFEGDVFNKALADKIAGAELRIEPKKESDAYKLDAEHLDLPDDIQRKLCVLRSKAVGKWQKRQIEKTDKLHNSRVERKAFTEAKLMDYVETNRSSKTRMTADEAAVHLSIWSAMEAANNSQPLARSIYEKETGKQISRQLFMKKFDKVLSILELDD